MKKIDKEFLITILYTLVIPAILYFILKLLQSNYHIIISNIDSKIPFIPYFIYFYILFFPFIITIFYITYIKNKNIYYKGIKSTILGLIITDIIFLIYPTIIYRPEINNSIDLLTRTLLNIIYFCDTPAINCFPSIHCLLCFQVSYMIISCKEVKVKYKLIAIVLSLFIILSTLFIKQHYFYDIIGSIIIFTFSNIIINKILINFNKKVDI